MYKGRSASLQRYHRVHEIDAQPRGNVEDDFIPTAANMSLDQCEAERAQLKLELAKLSNELLVAKRSQDRRTMTFLGDRSQSIQQRLGLIRNRLAQLNREHDGQALRDAVKEVVPADMLERIYARQAEIKEALCNG